MKPRMKPDELTFLCVELCSADNQPHRFMEKPDELYVELMRVARLVIAGIVTKDQAESKGDAS